MLRVIFRPRRLTAGAALAVFAVGLPAAWANLPQIPVKTQPNPIREYSPAVSADYFAWSQTSRQKPHHYNLFAQSMVAGAPSGLRTRVNLPNSEGFTGGIFGTRLVYQQIVNNQSDIRYFNLNSHRYSNPPVGVNSPRWESAPVIGSGGLMFTRFIQGTSRIILWTPTATHGVVLFSVPLNRKGTAFAEPGQLNGDYATFTVCTNVTHCSVYLYTISTATLTHITPPTGLVDYYSAVSSTGTLYFARSGPSCGENVQLTELPLGGTATTLITFNPGHDLEPMQTFNDGTNDQVFYTRLVCANDAEDIYQVTAP